MNRSRPDAPRVGEPADGGPRRLSLGARVLAALLGSLLVVVTVVAGALYASVERGFARYVRRLEEARLEPALERLAGAYEADRGWDALARDPERFRRMLRRERDERGPREHDTREARDGRGPPRADGRAPAPGRERRSIDPLELPPRVTLYDAEAHRLVGRGALERDASRLPIVVHGRRVGWLGIRAIERFDDELQREYVAQVRVQVLGLVGLALLLGLAASVALSRRLVRPVLSLREATRRLAAGAYDAPLPDGGPGELGDLVDDVRRLAETLAADEQARRRWVADTSHELRTPIAILRAEVEAMLDGVRPIDATSIASLDAELRRLGALVDDLAALSRSERGVPGRPSDAIELAGLVEEAIERHRARLVQRSLTIDVDVAGARDARVLADRARLLQVLGNVLENCARYTDPGGRVSVSATRDGGTARVTIDDAAPGVPADALPRLFDRFYRVEPSRARAHGGSGLGLAICRRIVEAHGGEIGAVESPLGGVRIVIRLPLAA